MFGWLRPQTKQVDPSDLDRGLRMLLYDGMCSQVMGVLTGGAFLVAFALLLGASNFVIGLLAAVGPLTQLLQIPAIFLVDWSRMRKALAVLSSFFSRLFLLGAALIPWVVPEGQRVAALLLCLCAYFGLGTISSCAFNSWMRDLIPVGIMGQYFGKRMAITTALGAVLTVVAAVALDVGNRFVDDEHLFYSTLFSVGALAGVVGVGFLARIPEPQMAPTTDKGLLSVLVEPFRERNFRRLLAFLASWSFAINLAAPFFTVYMLTRLEMSMAVVLGMAVLSQLTNVVFLRIWGRLADRLSNKSVLQVAGPLFVLSILLWPFTTLPETHFLTMPLLILIHLLAGMSTAGVTLCSGNIALKIAPRGKATAFLAANAFVNGMAATLAPIMAGAAADWFAGEELTLSLRWFSRAAESARFDIRAFDLQGLDFLFVIAVVLGLYAMHRLIAVAEEGEVEEKIVATELYTEVRKALKHVSNVAGLRHMTYFPYMKLKELLGNSSEP